MKTEVLLRSIGKINDELIADAESEANTKRKPGWAKLGTMAACLALVLCTGIATHAIRSNATAGTFTMDVNPSVEYTIAKSGIVKSVRCLNSDAENALSDVTLGKQSVETALTRTVAAYEACGYMKNGEATVLISFDSRLDANAELKASLSAEIQQTLEQTDAVGTLVFHSELTENAEAAKIAEEFHVSLGRADWILTAANKTSLPTDEVARMSLDELLKFQEASGIASVSVSKFISLEEAKKIALKDAKLDELAQKIVFTREELSRNQGKPCYLLEFYTGTNQYFYQIDAKSGSIIYAGKFITLSEAKKIALDDAGCKDKVSFTEETLVSGGIKTPYYRLVFADANTQWTYRIDAVLGNVLEKQQKEIVTTDFISLEEAKQIALKDAGLDETAQKIVFTREELSRNSGKPCYILEFYTAKKQYSYKVDAKNGSIMEAYHFILLADAKKIALDDAGVSEKVTFTEETLVAGGIKSPYYRFVFADTKTQWTYRIDAVLGTVLEKQQKEIVTTDFISLEEAKEIALKDAGLNESTQKIVFTREELNRNQGKPCYLLEFYTGTNQYHYQIDAKTGSIIYAGRFITLADAKKIALDDAGCKDKVSFTEETLVSGGIKTPYYRLVFADANTQWTYRIDAVLGNVLEKQQKEIVTTDFISLEEAKQIALKDAGLDETAQKIVFTREELSRNSGKPCYILEFYTAKKQYSYKVDAKNGSIMEAYHFILLADAKKIALDDAGVSEKVTFTEETLVAGGIKSPYYRFVFADTKTQWTYRIDAVLGTVLEKQQKEIVATDFISLEEAKEIALKDAGLNESTQKIVFTREELNRNSGKPCYILEFYTAKKQYSYKVDAKNGSIIEAYHFILLADAKKIALDDAGVSEKVTFTEETLVAGGIKSPYYSFAFESDTARWTYKIDAVLGSIMDKTYDKIVSPAPEFIGLEKAKQIALKDAGLDETAQKIVFTREELSRNSGKPCYILEFYTDKCAYSYKVDAVSGDIIGKKTDWFSRQESEIVPDTSQNSDSKQRRGN